MNIIRRDGTQIEFNSYRIFNAISKAFEACNYSVSDSTIQEIVDEVQVWDNIHIEDIQDQVEELLYAYGYDDVASEYKLYRRERALIRKQKDELLKQVSQKLEGNNIENQNANVDEASFGGRSGEASRVMSKTLALKYCMSNMARNNHENNEIYIHDLDSYTVGMHNCLTLPFDELLAKGFNTRQTDVRPANSINTAFQLVAVLFQLQSLQQFGGVAAGHLDWTMVPYVRKSFTKHLGDGLLYIEKKSEYKIKRFHKWLKNDKSHPDGTIHFDDNEFKDLHPEVWEYAMDMTLRELNQAVEGMYHNLNTLQSRSGNQLPFTSINYGTCTEPEGRMVIKALLEGSIKGVGKFHKTPIFPCGIFQLGNGINKKPEDPNYDLFLLALKSTSQRLYPNYANIDWSGNIGYDKDDPRTYFATMGKC